VTATATAAVFVWLGMVLAISFLETPLRFRAPGVDLSTGLAIGRLVFRGLNVVELVLATTILICVFIGAPHRAAPAAVTAATILLVQMCGIRPLLGRRSDRILAGSGGPRSTSHHAYVALEVGKVFALLATGVLLLTAA
jgi:hypothetical protein